MEFALKYLEINLLALSIINSILDILNYQDFLLRNYNFNHLE